jgi:hypothetical protein
MQPAHSRQQAMTYLGAAEPLCLLWWPAGSAEDRAISGEMMLNRFDRSSPMAGEAEVKYLDGDFRVLRPGAFVRCAVTGAAIPLEELKYWSVELQEAYVSPEAVLQRHFPDRVNRD